jgi:hypothetical protein
MSSGEADRQQLARKLDRLVARATRHLRGWSLRLGFYGVIEKGLLLLLAGALLALFLNLLVFVTGFGAWTPGVVASLSISLLPSLLYMAGRLAWIYYAGPVERAVALSLFDRQMGLKDRLTTADEFLGCDDRNGFAAAAIEDASSSANKALTALLDEVRAPQGRIRPGSLIYVPAALVVLLLALWIGAQPGLNWRDDGDGGATRIAALDNLLAREEPQNTSRKDDSEQGVIRPQARDKKLAQEGQEKDDEALPESPQPHEEADAREASDHPSQSEAVAGNAMRSQGRSAQARQSESQKSGDSTASKGSPSGEAPSSTEQQENGQASDKQESRDSKVSDPGKMAEDSEESDSEQATAAAAAPGSDDSSPSDDSPSGRRDPSVPRRGGDEKSQDGESDDESGSRGQRESDGNKKSAQAGKELTDSPPPPPSSEDQEASTAGGSKGQKKSRGVASMLLGVPLPDVVMGIRNSGPVQITQEETRPEEEAVSAVEAASRTARDRPMGHLEHPELSPWEQDLVEDYFLGIHKQAKENKE